MALADAHDAARRALAAVKVALADEADATKAALLLIAHDDMTRALAVLSEARR